MRVIIKFVNAVGKIQTNDYTQAMNLNHSLKKKEAIIKEEYKKLGIKKIFSLKITEE